MVLTKSVEQEQKLMSLEQSRKRNKKEKSYNERITSDNALGKPTEKLCREYKNTSILNGHFIFYNHDKRSKQEERKMNAQPTPADQVS